MLASPPPEETVARVVHERISALRGKLAVVLDADVVGSYGPITVGADTKFDHVLRLLPARRNRLAVVLYTGGGLVEVVERMVDVMRHYYKEVVFLIPDVALSAGTVLALSGDAIYMDHLSRLGPIDPQVTRDNKLVPALSYLEQYARFIEAGRAGTLSNAEFALLQKFDLAELHQFEQARELTLTLLKKWLVRFKFKTWSVTRTRELAVDEPMKVKRAQQIAAELNKQSRWHTHGRGISADTLRDELNLIIDDYSSVPGLPDAIRDYHSLMVDYLVNLVKFDNSYTHVNADGLE